MTNTAYSLKIESPVPPGAIVLSGTSLNQALLDKKFYKLTGQNIGGYFLFQKTTFGVSNASVPLLINYQGRLTAADGSTISGPVNLRFQMYDALSDGNLLWSETVSGVSTSTKIYNVILGAINPITPDTFSGPNAFLQTTVTQGTTVQTLSPRTQITSVPFALQAEGTMPTSAIILGSSPGALDYNDTGFIYSGSTIGGYPAFVKKDVDVTPPVIQIVRPLNYSAWNSSSIPITFNFSDDLSGVDPSSFSLYLNGTTVSSGFTVTESGVVGAVAAAPGMNIIWIYISDSSGNMAEDASFFYMDITGVPPDIVISPMNGTTISTSTPLILVDIISNSGIFRSSVSIKVDGIDKTEEFRTTSFGANNRYIWQVPNEDALPNGSNIIEASCMNILGLMNDESSTFGVDDTSVHPEITSLSPSIAFPGEAIKIIGSFAVPSIKKVTFFDGYEGSEAFVNSESGNTLEVTVPQRALSGRLLVNAAGYESNSQTFVKGLRYGFVTNYDNNKVTNGAFPTLSVIDFLDDTPGTSINRIPLSGAKPFDVAVTPDGRRAYVTDNTGNRIFIIDATVAHYETTTAILDSMTIDSPWYVKLSRDGLDLFVDAGSTLFYRINNNLVLNDSLHKIAIGTQGTGYEINDIDLSPIYQRVYITKSKGNNTAGEIYFIDINHLSSTFMQSTKIMGTTYRDPHGIIVKPDQSEVFVCNNKSNGTADGASFQHFPANGNTITRTRSATIDPNNDFHDVSHPFDIVFDPKGQLMYVSFSGDGLIGSTIAATNNIGVQNWRGQSSSFNAGTNTNKSRTQSEVPQGLAVSPDGKYIFIADFGIGAGYGSRVMHLKHDLVKLAIDNDSNTEYPYNQYNLTGLNPESIDQIVTYFPGILDSTTAFDGPRSIAFQEFPVIELYPPILHLALGGVAQNHDIIHARVHPIYGDSVTVGVSTGATLTEKIKFPGSSATFIPIYMENYRDVFSLTDELVDSVILSPEFEGIGEIMASVKNYPSNIVFVTIPPQEFIQVLFAEPCANANDTTYRALAAVVTNRIRLTRDWFHKSEWWGTDGQHFDFPPAVGHDLNGAEQIRAENASEELSAEQAGLAFAHGYYCKEISTPKTYARQRYEAAASRKIEPGIIDEADLAHYDNCVEVAGDAILDLTHTLTNDPGMWWILQPNPNYMDQKKDPTGGSFSFYSPTNAQWGTTSNDKSIYGALYHDTTTFPTEGNFEKDKVCGSMLKNFCKRDGNGDLRAIYIQVVVVEGIPLSGSNCGGTIRNNAPQFVFLRWRNPGDKAVVWGP